MSIRIVLVRTSHPGNIGSTARAMKTMGLESLYLVAPERFPASEATIMAAGADELLLQARVVPDVRAAIADCGLVVGTTARDRHLPLRCLEPRAAALEIAAAAQASEVAILFGAERTGLHNDDLQLCHAQLTIPTGSAYTSLNLAMAVQVVAYEVCLALRDRATGVTRGEGPVPLASAGEMEKFYAQLEQVLDEVGFRDRTGSGHLMVRLRRLFQRTVLDQNEMNILRGILTAVQGQAPACRRAACAPEGTGSMNGRTIYLDNAATTPVDPRVVTEMTECLGTAGDFANPASVGHGYGRRAALRVERARAEVAALVNADPQQIVFTSGATEANNLALLGAARFQRDRGRHIVTSRTEHPAVLDACRQLEREGCAVTYLKPGAGGIVEPAQVVAALRPDTLLVSLMHVNNEIGVIQDIGMIGRLCRERGVLFHVDAAQSAGKLPIDVQSDAIDLLSLTAHKLHGPKGVGALCVRREPRLGLLPLQFGGGQERGLRSGTLPTHQLVGFGAAYRIARDEMAVDMARITVLRDRLWQALAQLPGVELNGDPARRVAGILNVTIDGVEGESLLLALADLAMSSGSACASLNAEPSYVLRALGRSDRLAQSSLRLSLGRFTTAQEIEHAARRIRAEITRLRDGEPPATDAPQLPGDDDRYSAAVRQRLRDLRGAGRLAPGGAVASGRAGDREQGAEVEVSLRIELGRVAEARYRAFGCPHLQAAASWLTEAIRGLDRDQVAAWDWRQAAQALGIPPAKFGRLLTLQDALLAAARNWPRADGSTV